MGQKPNYEELEQSVNLLEKESAELRRVTEDLKRYQFMIESAHDAIFFKDLKSRYIIANEKTLEAFGLPKEDVIGKNDYELMPDLKEAQKNVSDDQIVFKSGKSTEIYKHMTGAEGNEYWFQAIKVPQFDNDGKVIGLVGIARDITEKKQAEEEKKILEKQLQQARKMESIGTLAGGIAHDFNNILEIILANTEFALGDIPKSNPLYDNLEEIKNASMNAAVIVKQLLNFSHKNNQELKPIDAINVIKDALKFLRSAIPSTIEFHTNIKTQEVTILSDPVYINQILMNLGSNASQSMDETGGILEINVEKETLKEESSKIYPGLDEGDYVKITVSDTGSGIEPDIINEIFDPYFTTKEFGEGTGMGLAVVHSIVKNHNGVITVDSQPGKGTTFTILFPVINVRPAIKNKSPDELPLGSESILLVDDKNSIVDITQKILERLGYRVITSVNPLEALKIFTSKPHNFDLVITDVSMPQMDGIKLSEKLKEVRPNIPIILFTGYDLQIDEEKAKKLGISACVMKPIIVKNIARTIRNVLDNGGSSS